MKNNLIFILVLIFLGVSSRTLFHLGPNVEYVTAASLLSGYYLGKKWGTVVPVAIMVISDWIIGTTSIFIFTWSAYVIFGLAGYFFRKINIEKYKIFRIFALSISAGLFFYFWTNFGVWFLDPWGMYSKTFEGLVNCYILGLPFLKYNLIGNIVFVPVSFYLADFLTNLSKYPSYKFTKHYESCRHQ